MHDIVLIESIKLCGKGIVVTAIVENMVYIRGSQTLYDPPEYAPCRCQITVPFDGLPDDIDVVNMDEEQLEEVLNRHVNLDIYDWEIVDSSDDRPQNEDSPYSRLYF